MNLVKTLSGTAAAAGLALASAGTASAWSVPVGTNLVSSCSQNGTLGSGAQFTLYTNVFQNGGVYTYQYDLKNVNDAAGLTGLAADFGCAPDDGTSAMNIFFGDAPDKSGTVYHDGNIGNAKSSTFSNPVENTGTVDYKVHSATMAAYAYNGYVVWQPLTAPLKAGSDMVSQFGYNGGSQYGTFGYLYVQSAAKPAGSSVYVFDNAGAVGRVTDCAGDAPCGAPPAAVPEPGAVASMGLGSLGVLGLLLRARKRGLPA